MMTEQIAYLFPGQGSQYVGMMKDLYEHSSLAREIIETADTILGYSLSKICFDGPVDLLQQTEHTQPSIFLHGYVLFKLLKENGYEPSAAAGHSLGEYTALVAAGALSFEDALRLVRLRGMLMQKAGEDEPGTMAAIIGLDPDTVTNICRKAREAGVVQPANFNAPAQIVVSGSIEAINEAMAEAKKRGAKLVKELDVSGAFHSPLMKSAVTRLTDALNATHIREGQIQVYTNVTAKPVSEPETIRRMLRDQITAPVRWEESVQNMVKDGYSTFFEIGPGSVLRGLLKRIDSTVTARGVDRWEDIEQIIEHTDKV